MTTTHSTIQALRRAMPWLMLTALASILLSPARGAAVVIQPAPRPQVMFNLYSIPGVYGTGTQTDSGLLETEFFCTSLETKETIHMSIELRDWNGVVRTTGNGGKIDVAPGQTVTIGTEFAPAFADDQLMSLTHIVEVGSARIAASSMKLMCAVVLFLNDGVQPSSMVELKVIKANFQTGD